MVRDILILGRTSFISGAHTHDLSTSNWHEMSGPKLSVRCGWGWYLQGWRHSACLMTVCALRGGSVFLLEWGSPLITTVYHLKADISKLHRDVILHLPLSSPQLSVSRDDVIILQFFFFTGFIQPCLIWFTWWRRMCWHCPTVAFFYLPPQWHLSTFPYSGLPTALFYLSYQ